MLKYIRYVAAGLLIAFAVWQVYRTGYQHGEATANTEAYTAIANRQVEIGKNLQTLETSVNSLTAAQAGSTKQLRSDMSKILADIKREPVVVIKNGKCIPSPTFLQGIDNAVNRANAK